MNIESPFQCDDTLQDHIRQNLEAFECNAHKNQHMRRAAVTLTIVGVDQSSYAADVSSIDFDDQEAAVILTRRSAKLKHHAGQWALPGGRLDMGETPQEAAIRELAEEVNLSVSPEQIMGRLDDFTTRSGFIMRPFVVWAGLDVELQANPEEVHSIHRVPLRELLRSDAPILDDAPHSKHPVLYMPVGNSWIASPTAALLYQFREVALLGRSTRVAHYDQPMFAWK